MLQGIKRILVTGAGGPAGINFCRSLHLAPESFHLIGTDISPYHLQRAETDERHVVPRYDEVDYLSILRSIVEESHPQAVYIPPDVELLVISRARRELASLGVHVFLPHHETVEICQNKYASYLRWRDAGIRVPLTIKLNAPRDLARAFEMCGPRVWLRSIRGGAGKGSLPTTKPAYGKEWIESHGGWGSFVACAHLEATTVTWQSIWWEGSLVVAQGRKRLSWEFGDRAPSGVTGLTGTGVTISDTQVDEIAQQAVRTIDSCPHGIFSVDMTYDHDGVPNPTEINIGRFFTTSLFFTKAGLNMPYLFVKLAFGEPLDFAPPLVNPLPPGLIWIRGIDINPILTEATSIAAAEEGLRARRARL
jgi:predicted ATP-grasp superfamily ATP-dependent carboligase